MRQYGLAGLILAMCALAAILAGCSSDSDGDTQTVVSSRSYKGHESDADSNNFVTAYPGAVGTRLDDCKTCHRAGEAGTDTETVYNSCDYCHLIEYPNDSLETGVPETFADTLNAFGTAYYKAGRETNAFKAIARPDSAGDGYDNDTEIKALRHPGSAESNPGQALAPVVTLNASDIAAMPQHSQFLLMVTTRQQFDDYVTYGGVTIADLLASAGVDMTGVEGVTVFAPDGFGKDFSIAQIQDEFPKGIFYQTPAFTDPAMELVNYPAVLPEGVADGQEIPDVLRLMLAVTRDGAALDVSYYESETGKLNGEGPYRLVIPQRVASRPDRGSTLSPYGDGWDYDRTIDHNAGACVRGACVIRVNPMPDGYEEYDWKNGWSLIEDAQVVIYGHGVTDESL